MLVGLTLAAASEAADEARHRVLDAVAGLHDTLLALTPLPPAPGVLERVRDFANNWQAVFAILFMSALVVVLWRTLKLMPQTKPVEEKPAEAKLAPVAAPAAAPAVAPTAPDSKAVDASRSTRMP